MESKYLNKHNKKVREQIERFVEGRKRLHGEDYFIMEYMIDDIKNTFNTMIIVRDKFKKEQPDVNLEELLKRKFPVWTDSVGRTMHDYIFYERMTNDNLKIFYDGLYTIQRILFLGDKYGSRGYWGGNTDSYIMINFRGGLAVYDKELVHAYLDQIPGPFDSGYPFYVSLATSIYLVLKSKLREASNYLKERLEMKRLTQYEHSILLCVKAIADRDELSFISEINNTLKLYPRQHFYSNLADYLSLEALGLYNLTTKVWGETPTEPESEYWDHDFFTYINDSDHKPDFLIDFSKLSPLFAKWIEKLPLELTITDLIKDIENSKSKW